MGANVAEPILVVSSDGHVTPPPEAVGEYLAREYHEPWLARYHEENVEWLEGLSYLVFSDEVLELIDKEHRIRTQGDLGWELDRRLREMDDEGIAAELLLAGVFAAASPFFTCANRVYPADVRWAGIQAYHRWVADFMAASNGRLFGVALPGPCLDLDDAVAELRWVAAHGFRSVAVPGIIKDPTLPPLWDGYYEPFWSACTDLDLVLSVHASHGRVQGEFIPYVQKVYALLEELGEEATPARVQSAMSNGEVPGSPFAPDFVPQEVLFQLIVGGVFDRHPGLRIAFTEVRADWAPAVLARFDARFDAGDLPAVRRPSEYWAERCYAGASSIKASEIRLRHEIGVDRLMFGRDYPHAEGTWPNTLDWLRTAFDGVPEDEARAILGVNAIRCYDLDAAKLRAVAARIGPQPGDVLGRAADVDPALVENFSTRGGYGRSMEHPDVDALDGRCVAPTRS